MVAGPRVLYLNPLFPIMMFFAVTPVIYILQSRFNLVFPAYQILVPYPLLKSIPALFWRRVQASSSPLSPHTNCSPSLELPRKWETCGNW